MMLLCSARSLNWPHVNDKAVDFGYDVSDSLAGYRTGGVIFKNLTNLSGDLTCLSDRDANVCKFSRDRSILIKKLKLR